MMIEVLAVTTLFLASFSAYNYGVYIERHRVKPVPPKTSMGFKGGNDGQTQSIPTD
jgi:hypothetical protein